MITRAGIRRFLGGESYAIGGAAIAVMLFIANVVMQHSFISPSTWAATLALASPFIVTGLAQTPPLLTGNGGLDLSVGPMAGFVAVLTAGVFTPHGLGSPELLIPLALGFGLAAGALNGVLIAYLRLPPIIATLGSYLFYTGMASEVLPTPGGMVPGWLVHVVGTYGPVPGVLIVFVLIAAAWIGLSRTSYLRNLLGVGGDERAAYTAGVNVAAVRLWAYAIAGLLSALAGLLLAASLNSGDATIGPEFTISSVAAVALGGVSFAGGRGGLLGAGLGGASYYMIQNLLTVSGVSVFELNIADGVILIAALAIGAQIELLRRRRHRRTHPEVVPVPQTAAAARSE
jgi:ribose transport system permease protein